MRCFYYYSATWFNTSSNALFPNLFSFLLHLYITKCVLRMCKRNKLHVQEIPDLFLFQNNFFILSLPIRLSLDLSSSKRGFQVEGQRGGGR